MGNKIQIDLLGLPWWLSGKKISLSMQKKVCFISELGRSPGEGNGNPIQYFCLGNLRDRGSWQATVHGVTKGWIRLSK